MRKLTKEQKRDIQAIAAKRDEDIDFSDASPILDWSRAEIGKFYRPKKKPVTMRLDSDVIAWLKADGRGYQTKANWLLRNAMLHFTKEASIGGSKSGSRRAKATREQLETAKAKGGKQRFLRHAGAITGGPPDVSSRKGFPRS
jgi:uncharacterized protein (DUF4415 family)